MRFSRTTDWNTEESELARAHRFRAAAGLPIADLTASNPTRCGFAYPQELLNALVDPTALDYDPQPRGSLKARQAVCGYYGDRGVSVDPYRMLLTTSTSEAYSFLFRLLRDPGSEVLVPQPSYPLFDFLADLCDVRLAHAPLVYDYGWQIDPEGLRRAVTSQTRAIVLVHPNNPTGHFTKAWEAEELARICREFDLSLIVDEVFLDYGFREAEQAAKKLVPRGQVSGHDFSRAQTGPLLENPERASAREESHSKSLSAASILSSAPYKEFAAIGESFASGLRGVPVFVVSGLSKVAGLPQMKAAWIVATGPDAAQAMDRLEVIADTFLSMNAPVQSALPAWLAGRAAIQRQIRERTAANLRELDRQLSGQGTVSRLNVEGGWYAILRIPAVRPDERTVLELLDRGVWVHPGYFFGMADSGWLVVSLLAPQQEFASGARGLIDYFAEGVAGSSLCG